MLELIFRMADCDYVLKTFSLCPAHGLNNEYHKDTSVSIATVWSEFLYL
jgi:hypothetical protein